ncbi:MATE family efflux transporter [bacterium 1XD42-1]|nr:MATE family efflux transporter [Oscillospiraceae bacterium]RKJ57339.1 MATE family efflux transporter [bacterium 1XD42-8]RKJ65440.1 MATE family efflux transporter [bacterium 1XD42-1]
MEQRENKMGYMPMGKLLVGMAWPIMLSMLVQALYNVVDSIYVSRLGENGLTALSLAFPVQNLIIAVGVGTAVGVNSLLSRKLGERRYDDANAVAENGLLLAVLSWLIFLVFGLFFTRTFFMSFTSNTEIIEMGTQYLSICTILSVGIFVSVVTERIMQATGKTIYTMFTQGSGAIINIVLDPILIFGLLGFPAMGIAGAAIATVIGQLFGMLLSLYLNAKFNKEIHIRLKGFRPNGRIIGEIYAVGVPGIVMQSISSVMTVGLNKILIDFTETAVAVFGVYFKLQSFVFMPVFGLTNALVPIVGYNYGAGNRERIVKAIKLAGCYAFGIMTVGAAIFFLFPDKLLLMFDASPDMLEIGIPALRTICISFMGASIGITLSSAFQAMGKGIYSLSMSACRQLVVILPVAWILGKLWGLSAVWFAFLIAEVASLALALILYRRIYNRQIKNLGAVQ